MDRSIYFCDHCKKGLRDVEDLLFVEEGNSRCFCSEDCIEKYYRPIVAWYEKREREMRGELAIESEDCQSLVSDASVMDKALNKPDEIWRRENELGEETYTFVRDFGGERPFHVVILCYLFERRPSFILLASATRTKAFVDKFRHGEKVSNPQEFLASDDLPAGALDLEIEPETMNAIEAKKSAFLARLLQERSVADIPFEKFTLYEGFFKSTLEDPDEIYSYEDDDGDDLFTYIKAYDQGGVSFYYFIICVEFERNEEVDGQTRRVIPLMAFPTLDGELYRTYKSGKLISGSLKN